METNQYGFIPNDIGMDQYLLIPFLREWTSMNPSYFDVNKRGTRFWHTAISSCSIITAWWYTNPSEKYESQLGWWNSQYKGKIKNVPNHQPVLCYYHLSYILLSWDYCWFQRNLDIISYDMMGISWYLFGLPRQVHCLEQKCEIKIGSWGANLST